MAGPTPDIAAVAAPWPTPTTFPTLGDGEVHVWRVALDGPPAAVTALADLLAPDERARADAFHFQRDQDRFVVGRGRLRTILGRYLDREPAGLPFTYLCRCGDPACDPARRKPALAPAANPDDLRFNLSHAGGLALIAVVRGREVGIDLERVVSDRAWEAIAKRFFAPGEVAALRALPAPDRPAAFYRAWTRKEAYLKARGLGLAVPLDQVVVSLAPDAPPTLLAAPTDPGAAAGWSLHNLAPEPGYVATLAVAGPVARLTGWQWPAEGVMHDA